MSGEGAHKALRPVLIPDRALPVDFGASTGFSAAICRAGSVAETFPPAR